MGRAGTRRGLDRHPLRPDGDATDGLAVGDGLGGRLLGGVGRHWPGFAADMVELKVAAFMPRVVEGVDIDDLLPQIVERRDAALAAVGEVAPESLGRLAALLSPGCPEKGDQVTPTPPARRSQRQCAWCSIESQVRSRSDAVSSWIVAWSKATGKCFLRPSRVCSRICGACQA